MSKTIYDADPTAGDAALEYLWKNYEEQARQREEYERNSMLIKPKPGFVAKTKTVEAADVPLDGSSDPNKTIPQDTKLFINICSNPAVGQAVEEPSGGEDGPRLRVPMSCGPLIPDKDVSGNFVLTCDVVFNPSTIKMCDEFAFRQYVVHIAGEKIQDKYKLLLDAEDVRYMKNIKYKGSVPPPPQRIRKSKAMIDEEAAAEEEAARPKSAQEAISKDIQDSLRSQRDHEVQGISSRSADIGLKEKKKGSASSVSSSSSPSSLSAASGKSGMSSTASDISVHSTSMQSKHVTQRRLVEEVLPEESSLSLLKQKQQKPLQYSLFASPQDDPSQSIPLREYLLQKTQAPVTSLRVVQRMMHSLLQDEMAQKVLGSIGGGGEGGVGTSAEQSGIQTSSSTASSSLHKKSSKNVHTRDQPSSPPTPPPEGIPPAPLCLTLDIRLPLDLDTCNSIMGAGGGGVDCGKVLAQHMPFDVKVRARRFAIEVVVRAKEEVSGVSSSSSSSSMLSKLASDQYAQFAPLILSLPYAVEPKHVSTTVNVHVIPTNEKDNDTHNTKNSTHNTQNTYNNNNNNTNKGLALSSHALVSVYIPIAFPVVTSPARVQAALQRLLDQDQDKTTTMLSNMHVTHPDVVANPENQQHHLPIATVADLGKIQSVHDLDIYIQGAFQAWHKYVSTSITDKESSYSHHNHDDDDNTKTFQCALIDEILI